MNGTTWAGRAKILSGPQLEAVRVSGFTLELWEDDNATCVLKASTLEIGAFTFTMVGMGAIAAGLSVVEGMAMVVVGVIVLASSLVVQFTNGDDFMGGVFMPQGAYQATSNANMVIVRSGSLKGRAMLTTYDATPPQAGATSSVHISSSTSDLVPVGAMVQFAGWAIDAVGIAAPDRAVTWASSNPDVFSVDQYGWVSGYAAGTATLTATVDGVSNSRSVSAVPYGPPTSLQVIPNAVELNGGQQQALTVRIVDQNGFELPFSVGSVSWATADAGVCTVDANNVVTAHGAPYWTTLVASIEDAVSDPVPCSVDGGAAFSRDGSRRAPERRLRR